MTPVGIKIKEARLKANLTQRQLAKKVGIPSAYVSRAEAGETAAPLKIAAAKILKTMKLEISSDTMVLSIPAGTKRAEMAICAHCNGTGQGWKFFG